MSDDFDLDLDGQAPDLPGGPAADGPAADGSAGPWFVRFAGRRTGPFDAERLRTLARRGALTRMHALSIDGSSWVPATSVRAVFHADGSVVAAGRAVAGVTEGGIMPSLPHPDSLELPAPVQARPVRGSALVRPVVVCALALATVALAMPTSRDDSGALAWWWSEGALGIAVRGLCSAAVLGGWVIAFLWPEPARAASVAAVAAVLAAAGSAALAPWAPWALVASLLVPVTALLVALDASGSRSARPTGVAAAVLAGIAGAGGVALGFVWHGPWWIAGVSLLAAGAASLGWAGIRAARRPGPGADGVFWACALGSTLALGSVFAAAFGALAGPVPMDGAQAAVAACLVLAFSAISWGAVHEATESAHLLPSAGEDDGAGRVPGSP